MRSEDNVRNKAEAFEPFSAADCTLQAPSFCVTLMWAVQSAWPHVGI